MIIIIIMRGSRNFRQGGGGPVHSDKKRSDNVFFFFFSPQLIYRSQMVNFKEIYQFSRFQRGPTFFQGEGSNFFWGGGGGPIAYSI